MWTVIGSALQIFTQIFNYFMGKKAASDKIYNDSNNFAIDKGKINPSADDREDIKNQDERIKKLKEEKSQTNDQ